MNTDKKIILLKTLVGKPVQFCTREGEDAQPSLIDEVEKTYTWRDGSKHTRVVVYSFASEEQFTMDIEDILSIRKWVPEGWIEL